MNKKQDKSEVKQVGRFGLVGILNTLVDIVILNILAITILPKTLIVTTFTVFGTEIVITGIVLAGLISGTVAMINRFVFNMRFTFKKQKIDTRHVVYFFLITMFGIYIIRPIILKLLTDVWVWPSQLAYSITSGIGLPFSQDFDQRNLALAVAILVVLVFNYLMYKFFVFTNNEKK